VFALGLSDLLSIVQTVAIIAALFIAVYFSRQQIAALKVDIETRVLNDLDEKFHRIGDLFIERPELIDVVYRSDTKLGVDVPVAYYVLFFCAHIFHMRERGVLNDNEWTGWLHWMQNAFRYGTLGQAWVDGEMSDWIDPSFRRFVEAELLPMSPSKGSPTP
jgi:hypothetical protein